MGVQREDDSQVTVTLLNGLIAKVDVLRGELLDQALSEFESSISAIEAGKVSSPDMHITPTESHLIRNPDDARTLDAS